MYFCSLDYFIFIVVVFFLYWSFSTKKQNILLLISSYVFYSYWDWRFLSLIILSTFVDYICGSKIYFSNNQWKKRKWLFFSLAVNLGLLAYFKYANFFIDSFIDMTNITGIYISEVTLKITLPIGISFYTFQSLSYTLDIYRKELKPTDSFVEFATFVAFFPQLVAGPIVRAKEFLYQLESRRVFKGQDLQEGCIRFLFGLFKKAFIADTIAIQIVDPIFSNPGNYAPGSLTIGLIGFTIQVYCDFSGYSDMAIGSARIMGFKLPENFNYPYLAKNFPEFWNRWHLTMGRFFRDYLFIPLGGSRCTKPKMIRNTTITWSIIGLWHGASWIYVTWGLLHGFFILLNSFILRIKERYAASLIIEHSLFNSLISWFSTQAILCLVSGYFRLTDLNSGKNYLLGLAGKGGNEQIILTEMGIIAFLAFSCEHIWGWLKENGIWKDSVQSNNQQAILYVVMILFLYHALPDKEVPFIYFQF